MNENLKSRKILGYDDVVPFQPGSSAEELVDVRTYDQTISTHYIKQDMIAYTGDTMYVRKSLAEKLARVNKKLSSRGYRLEVVYGYRHPEVQRRYFEGRRNALKTEYPDMDESALDRMTHGFVAIPDVAGHPAGAAVDLTIIDRDGKDINMGMKIADYSDPDHILTDAPDITTEQAENRRLLHDLMVKEGFAPFYGEWWHFSYGDREWAAFYNKKALYGAIDFRV
jgi:D-alanyl-D-alanine dipeptidase